MTPPLWLDESGHPRPTRPCPKCQREIPINRWPYQVMTFVEWCGHQQKVVLVPDGTEWYAEIPVVGIAR